MAFKMGNAAMGAYIQNTLYVLSAVFMNKHSIRIGFILVQRLADMLIKFFVAPSLVFLRFQNRADIHTHLALTTHIAPARLDAIAAFDFKEGNGQTQFLGKAPNGRIDIHRLTAEGTVAFREDHNTAALFCHLHAAHDSANIRNLLFNGDRSSQPLDNSGYPTHGENILRGYIVQMLLERKAGEKLVKAGLMIGQNQILAAILFLKPFHLTAIQAKEQRTYQFS